MFEKLKEKKDRYDELQRLISDPKVIQNNILYQKYAKELSRLSGIVNRYSEYLKLSDELDAIEKDLGEEGHDKEYIELARKEREDLKKKLESLTSKLEESFLEEDEYADRNVIMEIRAGTGGVEAGLFAADLFRLYSKYASKQGWKIETISSSVTEKGGFKEVIFSISGQGVYRKMKYESGTHRVQRVPETEASGRIHTSAVTVAVLPEAEEVDVDINPSDLRIDVFRAGGRGGQHVNVTDSAVRITHLPTGVVVSCQDERSQHKNKAKGMKVLRARVLDKYKQEQHDKISKDRKKQVGSGDRSEKIRTYNYPGRRVTDHRIGFTIHKLELVMEGEIDEIIDALKEADRKVKLGKR
ncbi:MAG: peptide chain release factor 1 [Candidatus Omnitrophica bacterium]|nr:peptide chain release factor 1 [Candidatus Omnitrophota bacterium]